MSENHELLNAVAEAAATQDAQPDPADFDITEWLTPVTQKDHRKTEKVTLIRDFSLEDEINEFNRLRNKAQQQQGLPDPDASVADATSTTRIEERMQELSAKIQAASMTVTVRAMQQDEIDAVLKGMKPENPMYWPTIFAECVFLPNGELLPVQKWPEFRNTIGDAQFDKLIIAFRTASFKAPVVNAPF